MVPTFHAVGDVGRARALARGEPGEAYVRFGHPPLVFTSEKQAAPFRAYLNPSIAKKGAAYGAEELREVPK